MSKDLKAVVKLHRSEFNLHVALLMRDGASKGDASVIAYSEGKSGLDARLPKGANS